MDRAKLKSRFLGCILGSALGDAIGEINYIVNRLQSMDRMETLTYTDDTAMSIGIMESILQRGDIEIRHLGDTFKRNFFREPGRGYAGGPPALFYLTRNRDISYPEGCRLLSKKFFGNEEGSKGNGSAMRIAPVGVFYYDDQDIYEHAAKSSMVTHIHPVAIDGAAVLAKAIALAVHLDPKDGLRAPQFLDELIRFSRTKEIRNPLEYVRGAVEKQQDAGTVFMHLGMGGVLVEHSLPFSIYSFAENPHSFEETLKTAAGFGGDADTMAAMACAISGAYLGLEGIPAEWIDKLENRDYLEMLALWLYELKTYSEIRTRKRDYEEWKETVHKNPGEDLEEL